MGAGGISETKERRREYAIASVLFNEKSDKFRALFGDQIEEKRKAVENLNKRQFPHLYEEEDHEVGLHSPSRKNPRLTNISIEDRRAAVARSRLRKLSVWAFVSFLILLYAVFYSFQHPEFRLL